VANALSAFGATLRRGVKPKTNKAMEAEIALHTKEMGDLNPNAAFKRKYGIPKKAAKTKPAEKRADSDYGFPLPPKAHPKAKRYAHAVLARAHQGADFDSNDLAKQVARAHAILGTNKAKPKVKESAPAPIRETIRLATKIREIDVDEDGKGAKALCVMLAEGPGNAADGHYYTRQCIAEAAESGVFEGAQSFADHSDAIEERNRPERSVRDLIGWWSDVKFEESNGRAYLIGTFNIESGNEFALNKMREAKRYSAKVSDPDKQYVGFSIYAGGLSESREINGKTYNAVLRITEAGSTDMVTRAGAGGKMLTLKEVQAMGKVATLSAQRDKKLIESAVAAAVKKALKESNGGTPSAKLVEAAINSAFESVKESLDDDLAPHLDKMKKTVAKHVSDKLSGKGDPDEDPDEEADDEMGELEDEPGFDEGVTGDADMDELLGDDDSDEDDDDEETGDNTPPETQESKRKESDRVKDLQRKLKEAQSKASAFELREKASKHRELARKLVREAKVPASIAKATFDFMVENCRSEKAMRAYIGTIAPSFRESVNGNAERSRNIREGDGALINVSGLEK
jgi:hypothetical protein